MPFPPQLPPEDPSFAPRADDLQLGKNVLFCRPGGDTGARRLKQHDGRTHKRHHFGVDLVSLDHSCSFSLLLRVLVNGLEQALHVGVLLFRR